MNVFFFKEGSLHFSSLLYMFGFNIRFSANLDELKRSLHISLKKITISAKFYALRVSTLKLSENSK